MTGNMVIVSFSESETTRFLVLNSQEVSKGAFRLCILLARLLRDDVFSY